MLVGISSDWLFPAEEVKALGERMREAEVEVEYAELQPSHGHDGFLAEPQSLALIVRRNGFNDSNSQDALSSHKARLRENF